jgi:hypothetical protein
MGSLPTQATISTASTLSGAGTRKRRRRFCRHAGDRMNLRLAGVPSGRHLLYRRRRVSERLGRETPGIGGDTAGMLVKSSLDHLLYRRGQVAPPPC